MHIELTRLLKFSFPKTKYKSEKKLYERCTSANWGDKGEISKAIAMDYTKNNDKEDFLEKNKQLKKKKQCLKQAAAKIRDC